MSHRTTSFTISESIEAIAKGINGLEDLQWMPPDDRLGFLTSVGIIIMAVQDEFGVEHFTEDEVDFINNASVVIENHLAEMHSEGLFDTD
tara:strand:+ start:162 stop:431 length:270 start_codon:yes stop_codon:yes gene_type:complete